MTSPGPAATHRDCPYFGLDYYDEQSGAWFFGRETERGQIITNLQAARLTLLHAESGVGKSSLLRAGVTWRLGQLAGDGRAAQAAAVDIPVVFSYWKDNPVAALITRIGEAVQPFLAGQADGLLTGSQLAPVIEAAADAANASLLIILDQFEEYFLYSAREPEPGRFADELAACLNQADLPANFLISIREEAYAGLGDLFNGRIANVYGNYLHVDYLDRASAEKAIRAPLAVYNRQPGVTEPIGIQDALVEAVLDQVRAYNGDPAGGQGRAASQAADGRVATPLLQLVMKTIWDRERAEGSPELRLSTLQHLEGVGKVVDTHLGKALRTLTSGQRDTAIDVFDHLVTPSGGKIAESVPDLALRTNRPEDQVGEVLEKLDHAFILRPIPAPPGRDQRRFRRYEIFHDVLAPAINRTIAAREEQRRTRRFRQLAALAVSLLLVVSAIGIVIGYLYTTARTDAQLAQSRQLAAAADEKLATDPELSTLLALQALRVHYTSEAESALRQALPEGQELRKLGDRTTVIGTAFDPADPGKVVSGGGNGDSWIWNAATGQRLIRLRPTGGFRQQGTADAMAFNQAGTQVAVGYGAGAVGVFSVTTGAQLRLATPPGLVSRTVNHVAFVGSSSRLAVATDSGAFLEQPGLAWLKLAGPASGQSAESVAFDPRDAMRYAAAASDSTDLCEVRPGKTPRCSALLQGRVLANDVGYSPDGREVVTANQDGSVRLYNAVSGSWIRTLQAIDGDATSAQFSPAGTFVAASYTSGVTRIWDPASGLQVAQLAGSSSRINSASFGAGGREIATASSDGTTRIWRALPPELDKRFSASLSNTLPSPGYGVSYSPDGTRLAVVDASGNAYVVSATGQRRIELSGLGGRIRTARFSPDGSKVVTTVGSYVDQWYSASARFAHDPIYLGRSESATAAAYSPDGSRLVVVTSADVAQVRDAASGRLLATLNPHDGFQLEGAAFRPGGRQILTVDAGGQALAWDAVTGHRVRALPKAGAPIYDVQFNRAGSRFVTAVGNDELTVWSAVTDRQLRVIPGCPTPNTASFSPDGTKIVAACSDGAARVFATRSGKLLSVLTAQGLVNEAEFSPDGRQIATAFGAQGTGGFAVWSSQLTTPSLPRLERLARKRVDRVFTTAEQAALISAAIGS